MTADSRLQATGVELRYGSHIISTGLDLEVLDGEFTAVVGPNGCGKSTLLKALARLIRPSVGQVILDGRDIQACPTRQVARQIGILPQSSIAPDGITVSELVARGRFPHQGFARRWTWRDEELVTCAMREAGVTDLATRRVDELSGGQRQRVWIAMALAQDTPILLLDEPTTFLDIRHQIELMELMVDLNCRGRCLVAVLHDLNQAARFATHLVAMRDGGIVAQGPPGRVVTPGLVEEVFGLSCVIHPDPVTGSPQVTPIGGVRPSPTRTPNPEGPT